MMKPSDHLTTLLRVAIGTLAPSATFVADPEALLQAEKRAAAHDLAHLFYLGMEKCGRALTEEQAKKKLLAVYRFARLTYDLNTMQSLFTSAKIPFIPLKGSVIRALYPEQWMRTSCDIDILVKEEDLSRATAILLQNGMKKGLHGHHDIAFESPTGNHIELHFRLIEPEFPGGDAVLASVWSDSSPETEGSFRYSMPDALVYYYHIAHMAKHVMNGGCGVRPFLDLYFMEGTGDEAARQDCLARGGLLVFAKTAKTLAQHWFSDVMTVDETTLELGEFVLHGGVYGREDSRIALAQSVKGGRRAYLFSRIFMDRQTLAERYPILKKRPFLAPLMQVVRWFNLFRPSRMKHSTMELRVSGRVDEEMMEKNRKLLRSIGLSGE